MKKSVPLTPLALAALLLFAWGCRKEENVSTDTAVTDTGITSTSTTATDTAGTTATTATTTGTMGTMMGTSGTGMMSTTGTMGMPAPMTTEGTAKKEPGKKGTKK